MRLSFEVSSEQHLQILSASAASGKTLEEYILDKIIMPDNSLENFDYFIKDRLNFQNSDIISQSVHSIFQEVQIAGLRALWQKGIDSGSAGELDMEAIKQEAMLLYGKELGNS